MVVVVVSVDDLADSPSHLIAGLEHGLCTARVYHGHFYPCVWISAYVCVGDAIGVGARIHG
jgi:hypothetical protein